MSFSYHMEQKIFIEESCTNNIHIAKKAFCSGYLLWFVSRFFSEKVKTLVAYLKACMNLF